MISNLQNIDVDTNIPMESSLTKRRPSLIPGSSDEPTLLWSPSFDTVFEDSSDDETNETAKRRKSDIIDYLPSITEYEKNPSLIIKKFQYKNPSTGQTTNTSMAHTHGLCILNTEEEQIIACDHFNNRLLMFDSINDGQLLEMFRGELSTPECVAARPHYRQQIYVTKAHSLALYDLEKKVFIRTLGNDTDGHANNRFHSPGGVTVDPENGEIYMCDRWNYRICVFSPDFRYVNRRWYLSRGQKEQHKIKPRFIAINSENRCVVTCEDAPTYRGGVYLFDKMGYIQKIYDHDARFSPMNVEARLNIPHGILLDNKGNWLTMCYSDPQMHSIERRSLDDENGEKEKINYWQCKALQGPSALAMKRDGTLVVGDRDDNAICLFKLLKN